MKKRGIMITFANKNENMENFEEILRKDLTKIK